LIDGYSSIAQFISETYAADTEYGIWLRLFGHIPSGILFFLFYILAYRFYPQKKLTKFGFYGMAIFYGLGTVLVSIFPCDAGCNKDWIDPSLSQIIHNLTAMLLYIFAPICILCSGLGLRRIAGYDSFKTTAYVLSIVSFMLTTVFFYFGNSNYVGLLQRLVELTLILWLVVCASRIRKTQFTCFK
jgi:hypothetical protein